MYLKIFSLILGYTTAPSLYYRTFSNKIIKKAPTQDKVIALTFDDGPDPRYTPELLDILKANNIKCTFFVLAESAKKYPDIIKRIKNEGHSIGLHSLKHTNEIFLLPNQIKKDFSDSISIMGDLGVKITLFRPPWGLFNSLTYHYAKINNIKIVLWSIHAMDWSRWVTSDYIEEKLKNTIKPGDIILLHDGRGAENSPRKTINALRTLLPILKKKGYFFTLLDNL